MRLLRGFSYESCDVGNGWLDTCEGEGSRGWEFAVERADVRLRELLVGERLLLGDLEGLRMVSVVICYSYRGWMERHNFLEFFAAEFFISLSCDQSFFVLSNFRLKSLFRPNYLLKHVQIILRVIFEQRLNQLKHFSLL